MKKKREKLKDGKKGGRDRMKRKQEKERKKKKMKQKQEQFYSINRQNVFLVFLFSSHSQLAYSPNAKTQKLSQQRKKAPYRNTKKEIEQPATIKNRQADS